MILSVLIFQMESYFHAHTMTMHKLRNKIAITNTLIINQDPKTYRHTNIHTNTDNKQKHTKKSIHKNTYTHTHTHNCLRFYSAALI